MDRSKSAENAWKTRKGRAAQKKAHGTSLDAIRFTKNALKRKGYRHISFESKKRYESPGIVDLVAVKRQRGSPDRLRVSLIQVKGGSARVSEEEKARLRKAVRNMTITWNVAEKRGKSVRFSPSLS